MRLCLSAVCLFAACSAFAQNLAKPVRIIVPTRPAAATTSPGGCSATSSARELGQPFIVENRVGGGHARGNAGRRDLGALRLHPADGRARQHGLQPGAAQGSALRPGPRISRRWRSSAPLPMPWSARKDLRAIHAARGASTLARANPGRLTIATSGIGTGQHISAVLLKRLAGVDLLEVDLQGRAACLCRSARRASRSFLR